MATTKWMFPNRTSVGRATYNIRTLLKDIDKMDIPAEVKDVALKRVRDFENFLKNGFYDVNDQDEVIYISHG